MLFRSHLLRLLAAGSMLAALGGPLLGWQTPEARKVLLEAKSKVSSSIPLQAEALARLAWPDEPHADPIVSAMARRELIGFGEFAVKALRTSVGLVAPRYRADALAAMIECRERIEVGIPPGYISGIDEALWFGSADSQRQAMQELAQFGFPPALLSTVDAVHIHPELIGPALDALGLLGDDRARFFTASVLYNDPEYRSRAARSLAAQGGQSLDVLRSASRQDDPAVREAAIVSLIPQAGLDDLTVLHEYIGLHPDDNPQVLARARQRAAFLENLLEQQQVFDE